MCHNYRKMIIPKKKLRPDNIEIFDYYEQNESFKKVLLSQIKRPSWRGAKYLYNNIKNGTNRGKLFIMFDKDRNHIISFGALTDFDEIETDKLKPWIGSIYTFEQYRGNRYSEKLIKYILSVAKREGNEFVYLSSDHIGLYEKYGFELYGEMQNIEGKTTQVFVYDTKKLEQ